MKNSCLNEVGAWNSESGCHSVITQNIITSNLWETSDKTVSLLSEEMERDGVSHVTDN
jgi:hypothetical protein